MITRKAFLAALRKGGYNGLDTDDNAIKTFCSDKDLVDDQGKALDLDSVLANVEKTVAQKKVTISVSADAGEEVDVQDGSAEAEAEPEEAPAKSKRPSVQAQTFKAFNIGKSSGAKKAYNALPLITKATPAMHIEKGLVRLFPDADVAEYAGAWLRNRICGKAEFYQTGEWKSHRLADQAILKTWASDSDANGGALVPTEMLNFFVANLSAYGFARRIAGVTKMSGRISEFPQQTDDVDVAWSGQGAAGSTNSAKPATERKQLIAKKLLGTKGVTSEEMNDSAFNVADTLSRSFARALSNAEDDAYLNATGSGDTAHGGFTGLLTAIGAASTVAAAGNDWDSLTHTNFRDMTSRLPSRFAGNGANLGFASSRQFYHQVALPIMENRGGVTLLEGMKGVMANFPGANAAYGGEPWYFTDYLPTSSDNNQICCLYGNFEAATKFGETRNSYAIETSDQFKFDEDEITVRGKERVAINCHDCGSDSVVGGVIALQTAAAS